MKKTNWLLKTYGSFDKLIETILLKDITKKEAETESFKYALAQEVKDHKLIELKKGMEVEVPEPNETDIHQHSFVGTFDSVRNNNIVVLDGDGDAVEIEPERLEIV